MISVGDYVGEARAFLDRHAALKPAASAFVWGCGSGDVSLFEETAGDDPAAAVAEAKRWAGRRFDAGFGWVDRPPAHRGRGGSPHHQAAYSEPQRPDGPTV